MAEGTRKRTKIEAALEKAQELNREARDNLDEAIAEIDRRLAPYMDLKDERDKLVKARNALSGGSALTGAGGMRLTWQMIAQYVEENPGKTPEEIATHFNAKTTNVTSALYRQKESFINKNGRYYRRDPEAGINTADDIEED
jgi:hypothetical protein